MACARPECKIWQFHVTLYLQAKKKKWKKQPCGM